MATEIMVDVIGSHLYPSDPGQAALLDDLQGARGVKAVLTKPRNPKAHRLFWALMGIVSRNSETYDTATKAATYVKIATGHVEVMIMPGKAENNVVWVPKSISFGAMDDLAFRPFLDKAIAVVCDRMIPGTSPDHVKHELAQMTGFHPDTIGNTVAEALA